MCLHDWTYWINHSLCELIYSTEHLSEGTNEIPLKDAFMHCYLFHFKFYALLSVHKLSYVSNNYCKQKYSSLGYSRFGILISFLKEMSLLAVMCWFLEQSKFQNFASNVLVCTLKNSLIVCLTTEADCTNCSHKMRASNCSCFEFIILWLKSYCQQCVTFFEYWKQECFLFLYVILYCWSSKTQKKNDEANIQITCQQMHYIC